MNVKVSLVEDDGDIRESLSLLIRGTSGFEFLNSYSSAEDALAGLEGALPDVVLMDIHLPKASGIECVRSIKQRWPGVLVVMLTVFDDSEELFESLRAGASGYLLKRTSPSKILEAILEVWKGGAPMSPTIARMVVERFSPEVPAPKQKERFSEREEQILNLLSQGYRYKEIAHELGIAVETVHSHLRRIYDRLQVRSKTEAVVKFLNRSGRS